MVKYVSTSLAGVDPVLFGEFANDYERKMDLILSFMDIEHEIKDGFVYSKDLFNPFTDLNDAWEFAEYAKDKEIIHEFEVKHFARTNWGVVYRYGMTVDNPITMRANENPAEALTEAVLKVLEEAK